MQKLTTNQVGKSFKSIAKQRAKLEKKTVAKTFQKTDKSKVERSQSCENKKISRRNNFGNVVFLMVRLQFP